MQLIKVFFHWKYDCPKWLAARTKAPSPWMIFLPITYAAQLLAFYITQTLTLSLLFLVYFFIFWPFAIAMKGRSEKILKEKIEKSRGSYFEGPEEWSGDFRKMY